MELFAHAADEGYGAPQGEEDKECGKKRDRIRKGLHEFTQASLAHLALHGISVIATVTGRDSAATRGQTRMTEGRVILRNSEQLHLCEPKSNSQSKRRM